MVDALREVLDRHLAAGTAPGIVAVSGRVGEQPVFTTVGDLRDDAIFRIQSMTKAVTGVAALRLVQAGRLSLDDSGERWLPELANRRVLRTVASPLDDTVPATRPITVRHLLTNMSGYGAMTAPCPLQDAMIAGGTEAGAEPVALGADEWLAALADLPLAFDPGAGWRYHHSFGILGILISRLVDRPLEDHLRDDLLAPLGMRDTGFTVPAAHAHRLPATYRHHDGALVEVEPAATGFYIAPAPFDLSHAELVSTAADYAAFAAMLAAGGRHGDEVILDPSLLAEMTRDQIPADLKTDDCFYPGFWDGLGWGFGVAVQDSGRYGWSGGEGTDFFIDPDGSFRIVPTQVQMGDEVMALFADVQAAST